MLYKYNEVKSESILIADVNISNMYVCVDKHFEDHQFFIFLLVETTPNQGISWRAQTNKRSIFSGYYYSNNNMFICIVLFPTIKGGLKALY